MKRLVPLLVTALALATAHSGCRDSRTKEEKLAAAEQQIEAKIESLHRRQQQIAGKLVEMETRLAHIRAKREQIRTRWSEPKVEPHPTPHD